MSSIPSLSSSCVSSVCPSVMFMCTQYSSDLIVIFWLECSSKSVDVLPNLIERLSKDRGVLTWFCLLWLWVYRQSVHVNILCHSSLCLFYEAASFSHWENAICFECFFFLFFLHSSMSLKLLYTLWDISNIFLCFSETAIKAIWSLWLFYYCNSSKELLKGKSFVFYFASVPDRYFYVSQYSPVCHMKGAVLDCCRAPFLPDCHII